MDVTRAAGVRDCDLNVTVGSSEDVEDLDCVPMDPASQSGSAELTTVQLVLVLEHGADRQLFTRHGELHSRGTEVSEQILTIRNHHTPTRATPIRQIKNRKLNFNKKIIGSVMVHALLSLGIWKRGDNIGEVA